MMTYPSATFQVFPSVETDACKPYLLAWDARPVLVDSNKRDIIDGKSEHILYSVLAVTIASSYMVERPEEYGSYVAVGRVMNKC